jgi:hypothetical protein
MEPVFCTECDKHLEKTTGKSEIRYNAQTGKPYEIYTTILTCPDYVFGYSDRQWHYHDRIVISSETKK